MFGFFKKKKKDVVFHEPAAPVEKVVEPEQPKEKPVYPVGTPKQPGETMQEYFDRCPSWQNGTAELCGSREFNRVMHNITLSDKFGVRSVKFTDAPLPRGAGEGRDMTVDVSKNHDSGVIAWYNRENGMVIVTSQRYGVPIKAPQSLDSLLQDCQDLEFVNFDNLDTSETTNFCALLQRCYRLRSVDLRPLDVSSATNMSHMFEECRFLEHVDTHTWNATNIETIRDIFAGDTFLKSVDLSGLHSPKPLISPNIFSWCGRLESLDVSSLTLDIDSETVRRTFHNCVILKPENIKCTDPNWIKEYHIESPYNPDFKTNDYTGVSHFFDKYGNELLRTGAPPQNPFSADEVLWEQRKKGREIYREKVRNGVTGPDLYI